MNYEQDYSHFHCWEKETPPCGLAGKHRCCLCKKPVPTMNWIIDESGSVPRGVWEQATEAQEALDKWKKDVDDSVRNTVKPIYKPMNWIDELGACLTYCKQQNGRPDCKNCGLDADIMAGALIEARTQGVEVERKRVLEWVKEEKEKQFRKDVTNEYENGRYKALDDVAEFITNKTV